MLGCSVRNVFKGFAVQLSIPLPHYFPHETWLNYNHASSSLGAMGQTDDPIQLDSLHMEAKNA